jgi:hypothetical protein
MTEMNQATCEHRSSLLLEPGERGGYRVLCGSCWSLGPEREEPSDAVLAFRRGEGSWPSAHRAA